MKKYSILILALIIALMAVGCQKPLKGNDQGEPHPGDTIITPDPQGETVELTLYFANTEYAMTGDEKLEKLLTEKRQVTVTNKSLAETAMEELIKGPEGEDASEVIPSKVELISVEVADNIAYVNFSSTNMGGGSLQEYYLIDSVIMTLTELEDINAVQFLVDGKKTESLMGHIYTMDPMGRNGQ
jgi:spore germination protein GerM